MNLTDTEVLKFQKGSPVFLEDICAVYPATIGQIVDEGYDNFQKYLSVLIAEKPDTRQGDSNELTELLEGLSDFQYLLLLAVSDIEVNTLVKKAFRFFTHDEVTFSLDPPTIIVGPIEEQHMLTEKEFANFQRLLKRMYFIEQEGEEIIIYDDDPPATKRLKMQMRKNREKVRKAKAAKAVREKSDTKFSDLIGSLPLDNCGVNMINIWDMTYYAFHDQLKRMGWRDQFNINNQAALAGAKLKKSQLKHWIRPIADSDKS